MTESSNPHFIEPVRAVDPVTCRILRLSDHATAAAGSRYFVAGAAARDLMLVNAFGMTPGRATRDIDFGIAIESWNQLEMIQRALIGSNECEAPSTNGQRLFWRPAGVADGIPVDIIPFDGVASGRKTIAWPPRGDVVMNVAGFEEAFDSSARMRIEADLVVRIASIPGLAVLKLIAWKDRRQENNKDATDLHRLLTAYADAGNLDRIYGEELALLERVEYDMELAGSELLGRDAARICQKETHSQISGILSSEQLVDQLIRQMHRALFDEDPRVARIAAMLKRFTAGFLA